jgi:release factor glutamine methyltransferase
MASVARVVEASVNALCEAGFSRDEARQDAVVLARGILGWSLADWLARSPSEATDDFQTQLSGSIERRRRREPVAYILGEKEFYGRPFRVTHDTLIPRPETEGLVEAALEWLHAHSPAARPARIVDVGTGTGCIAITLALECRDAGIVSDIAATDISKAAIEVARENARRLGATEVDFRFGNILAGVSSPIDLIVSNPPYVANRDRDSLPPDVVAFEPEWALFAGEDGLDVIEALVMYTPDVLSVQGALMLEIGIGQVDQVRNMLGLWGFAAVETRQDLQDIERIVIAHKTGPSL